MEKILKIIKRISLLIPFLIIFFYIKPVYAENRYVWSSMNRTSIVMTDFHFATTQPTSDYNFNKITLLDNDYYFGSTKNDTTITVFKNKESGIYYVICFKNSLQDILFSAVDLKYDGLHFYNSDNDNILNNYINSGYIYIPNFQKNINYRSEIASSFGFRDSSQYLNTIGIDAWSSDRQFWIGVLSQTANSSSSNMPFSYLYSHLSDFEFVYSNIDFYVDEVRYTGESSTPDPDTPTPDSGTNFPYLFDNNKYYVPNYSEGQCVEVLDKDTIRVFNNEYTNFYIDYYINSNYISRQGQTDLDYVKQCSNLKFTNVRYYGNDFPQTLFITLCILLFTIGFPYVLYKRFRKR